MHILVDIRSEHPEDVPIIRYALNWAKKWKYYNPVDICTFLIFENQEAPEWENFFRVRPTKWFSGGRKIQSTHKNEVLRCVNFSRYAPYDKNIPTITHIFDMAKWFYDNETNANILRRKEREYEIKKRLHNSSHILVPNFFTGNELVELWNVHEKNIDIFPLLCQENINPDNKILEQKNFLKEFFLHDASYGAEANIDILLEQFAKYRENGGKYSLVLHGKTDKYLSHIAEKIKLFWLEHVVYITGCLDMYEHEALYNHAKWWIFIGAYNTTKVGLSLAKSKKIPVILSDIPAFSLYTSAKKIHPNHLENLHTLFHECEKWEIPSLEDDVCIDEKRIFQEYKNILSKNPNLSPYV